MNPQSNEILYLSFNQDQACFAVGTEQGFKIYNSHPYKDTFQRGNIQLKLQILMEESE